MLSQEKYVSKLRGHRVLIFGGSSGVGLAVAEGVIEFGGHAIISSSQQSRVDQAVERLNSRYPNAKSSVAGSACNLLSPNLENSLHELFKKHGKVDHIIFTAGDSLYLPSIQDWSLDAIIDAGRVRFFAPLIVTKVGSQYLNPGPRSSITFTGAALTQKPRPGWAVTTAYASAMHGLVKALAIDLKPARVNVVDPFATRTEMWGDKTEAELEEIGKDIAKDTLTGIFAYAEDVAEAYLYTMKDANVTGTVIGTNSGWPLASRSAE
ncbi:hypothetical protein J3E68DRAFT_415858 [Trichoderma sp. SZMC 28012]